MIDLKLIDDLSRKLSESLPPGLARLKEEADEHFHQVLTRAFERMNLVTREEFDAQSAVLARTREKLEQLKKQLEEMERQAEK